MANQTIKYGAVPSGEHAAKKEVLGFAPFETSITSAPALKQATFQAMVRNNETVQAPSDDIVVPKGLPNQIEISTRNK